MNGLHSKTNGSVASGMQKYFMALCGFMLVMLTGITAHGQTATAQIGNGTNTSRNYGPIYQSSLTGHANRHVYLYTQEELATVGIVPGSLISEFSWFKTDTNVLNSGNSVRFEMFQRSGNDVTTIGNYASNVRILEYTDASSNFALISDTTYNAGTNNIPKVPGWWTYPVRPFIYKGGSLEIYILTTYPNIAGNVTTGTVEWRYDYANFINSDDYRTLYSGNNAPSSTSTYTRIYYRPNVLISYQRPGNNAGTSRVTEPKYFCAGTYSVKVEVKNNGNNAINNLKVNWSIDGVLQPQVTSNKTIDVFGSTTGNSDTIALGNVSFARNVPKVIKVWTSLPNGVADTTNNDDTLVYNMKTALSGAYTIGGTNPDFPDVASAVNEMNTWGLCGPATFNIRSGVYTGYLSFDSVPGSGPANPVVFQSTARNSDSVIVFFNPTIDNKSVVTITSTSNITFRNLSFRTSSTSNPRCFTLFRTTSNITIDSCKMTAVTNMCCNAKDPAIIFAGEDGIVNGIEFTGSNIVITNSLIRGGSTGIWIEGGGSTTVLTTSIRVENNIFDSTGAFGANFLYLDGVQFKNNTITSTTGYTGSTVQDGVSLSYVLNAFEVTGNKIFMKNKSTSTGICGIRVQNSSGKSTMRGLIANNMIVCDSGKTVNGINIGSSGYLRVYNNSVHVMGGDSATSFALVFAGTGSAANYNEIKNNVFVSTAPLGARGAVSITLSSPSNNTLDYNAYYSTGRTLVYHSSSPVGRLSLSAWRSLRGQDMNSTNYLPAFMANNDLRPNPADPASWVLNGRGEPLPGNDRDITGAARSTSVKTGPADIGAYEFVPTVAPPAALATPNTPTANTTQVFTLGEDTVATMEWGATVPSSVTVRQYSGVLPPANTLLDSMYFYTDISTGTGSYSYTNNIYYKNIWLGSLAGERNIRLSQKNGANPWTTYTSSTVDTGRNIITASNLTTAGLFSGVGQQCSGTPLAPTITTPVLAYTQCPGSAYMLNAAYGNDVSGISYQWEQSANPGGPWNNVTGGTGAGTLAYNTPAINSDVFYRLKATCINSSQSNASTPYSITLGATPQIISAPPVTRCGPGFVELEATASPGATIYWYDQPTGGVLLDTGNTYTTPPLTANTNFYAAAVNSTKLERVVGALPGSDALSSITASNGLAFTVNNYVTINSVDVYVRNSSGATSASIQIKITDMSNNLIATGPIYGFTATGGAPALQVVPVNVSLPPGNYKMGFTYTGINNIIREISNGIAFPYASPSNAVVITASSTSSSTNTIAYNYFYNWSISIPCESPRQAVAATLGSSPAFSVAATTPVACNNGITELKMISAASLYDTVSWTPVANLYTDAAATIPYTGGNTLSVYAKTSVAGQQAIEAKAYNTVTNCGNLDTARFYVLPATARATANPTDICVSGSTDLRIDHAEKYPGSYQWQSSTNGASYTDIPSATTSTYTTPNLTSGMYYRLQIKNSAGAICLDPSIKVNVVDGGIASVVNGNRCGYGTVSLSVNTNSSNTVKWYTAQTGGTEVFTGNPFVTPVIGNTTTYYAESQGAKRSAYAGRRDNTTATTGNNSTNAGLLFDATIAFTLDSVAIYPIGTGIDTMSIILVRSSSSSPIIASKLITVEATAAPGKKTIVPLGFAVPKETGLKLLFRSKGSKITGLVREQIPSNTFPYTVPGFVSINDGTGFLGTNTYYGYFYDWFVSTPCVSPRQAVIATVTTPPAINVSANPATICLGKSATLSATSGNTGYTYTWTPGGQTGSPSVSPTTTTKYYVAAADNGTGPNAGCTNRDSVTVFVNPLPTATLTTSGSTNFCEGDSVSLFANTGAGYSYQWRKGGADIAGANNSSYDAKTSGSYAVAVTDGNTCENESAPVVISVTPAPVPVITRNGNVLSTGTFASYQWRKDGQPISGATSQTYTMTGNGNYSVTVTDGTTGCSGTSANFNPVGISGVSNVGYDVKIYPNPASSVVHIDAPAVVNVMITTLDGKQVLQQDNAKDIDILRLPNGVYMIRVMDENNIPVKVERLVKVGQ